MQLSFSSLIYFSQMILKGKQWVKIQKRTKQDIIMCNELSKFIRAQFSNGSYNNGQMANCSQKSKKLILLWVSWIL